MRFESKKLKFSIPIKELSAALIKALNDRAKLAVLSSEGKARVFEELSLDRMSESLSKVYNSIQR